MAATVACPSCGALNEPDFERCIRCSRPLTARPDRPSPAVFEKRSNLLRYFDGNELIATKAFVALTLLVFGAQVLSAITRGNTQAILFGSNIVDDVRFGSLPLMRGDPIFDPWTLLSREPWRLVTAVFVHFGGIHFGLNMFWLVRLGRQAESMLGSGRFSIAYVVSGVAGFVASSLWYALSPTFSHTAGASGSVFGIMGLSVGVLLRWRDPRWKPMAVQAFVFVAISAVAFSVNNAAHIGGLLAGAAVGALFANRLQRPQATWEVVLGCLAWLLCLAALGIAQTSDLPKVVARLLDA